MDDDNGREVERLRARIRDLEAELAEPGRRGSRTAAAPGHTRRRGRGFLAGLLLATACLLAPLAVTAVWASTQVSDTEQYVKTVAPIADDPDVQQALAVEVTDAILENIRVGEVTAALLTTLAERPDLPPRIAAVIPGLAAPITSGVETFTRSQVERLLGSARFATLWAEVNRAAHAQVVALLEGDDGGALSADGDAVTLNLGPIIDRVKDELVARGFTLAERVPTVDRSFVLMQSETVTRAQGLYRVLNILGVWLPMIALFVFAAGVVTAAHRRRALLLGSLGVVVAMLALGVALAVARLLYTQSTPGNILSPEAAGTVFDALVRYLRSGLRSVAVLGLLVAVTAFLTGPSTTAVGTRAALTRGIGGLRGGARAAGWSTGPVGAWTYQNRQALRVAAVIAGGLVLVFWTRPTVGVVVGTAALVALAVGIIEFLAHPPVSSEVTPLTGGLPLSDGTVSPTASTAGLRG